MNLTESNCSVDKDSGAVIIHKSPELLEIIKLKQEVNNLSTKLDKILELLEGGSEHGKEVG